MFRKLAISLAALTALTATSASATIFQKDYADAGVWTNYNSDTETYSMKFRSGENDGFWLVVSDGDNPKGDVNEYAILYGDLENNRITAYNYDGRNGPNSYKTGDLLGTYEGVFADGGTMDGFDMSMFSIDVSALNTAYDDASWDGVQYGESLGIWFHQSAGSDFSYGADGSLAGYSFTDQMWLDTSNDAANIKGEAVCAIVPDAFRCTGINGGTELVQGGGGSVPVPAGFGFILLAGAAAALRRKR